jgi:hypothetical protein
VVIICLIYWNGSGLPVFPSPPECTYIITHRHVGTTQLVCDLVFLLIFPFSFVSLFLLFRFVALEIVEPSYYVVESQDLMHSKGNNSVPAKDLVLLKVSDILQSHSNIYVLFPAFLGRYPFQWSHAGRTFDGLQ